jgi:hypothetical protein
MTKRCRKRRCLYPLFKTSGETLVTDQPIEKYFRRYFQSIYLELFCGVEW